MTPRPSVLAGLLMGAGTYTVASRLLSALPPGGADRWNRRSFAGTPVSLLEGPAIVLAVATAGCADAPVAVAAIAAGAFGLVDDVAGEGDNKGLLGHCRALRAGRLTTGALKVVGLAATGALVTVLTDGSLRGWSTGAGAGVIAASANAINLFDLRPGRALKVTLLAAVPLLPEATTAHGVLIGAAVAALPADLRGHSMLGDAGANALGAMLGALAIQNRGQLGRGLILTVLVGLTLASERVSFTAVIASSAILDRIDQWGRATSGPPGLIG